MQIDRMELADFGSSLAIAEGLLKQLGDLEPPIPIEEIAYACGITEIHTVTDFGFEGALIATDEKMSGMILVNSASHAYRRRFTIGHELGHLLNPWHVPPPDGFHCSEKDLRAENSNIAGRPEWEAQANEFAANVLLPKRMLIRDMKKFVDPGLDEIVSLSGRYQISVLATARRFIRLHGDPMALVRTKDGVVEEIYRENGFPYITLQRGQQVHRHCATATFSGPTRATSATESTETSFWIDPVRARRSEMFEQVLVQSGGYRTTLLSLSEGASEDDEDRSAWRPAFHR